MRRSQIAACEPLAAARHGLASTGRPWLVTALAMLTLFVAQPSTAKGPLKVFVLAGQSNMQGMGVVRGDRRRRGGIGSLDFLVRQPDTAPRYRHLVDERGRWKSRSDVWVWTLGRKGELSVGYGATPETIGPELQFGHRMGDHFDEQVLLIKAAWGAQNLFRDFRPPSSGLPDEPILAAMLARASSREPGMGRSELERSFGATYRRMIATVTGVLENLAEHFPTYDGGGYEIVGFGWHQGWSDGTSAHAANAYEANLANLIRDVRKDLHAPGLPVVIATSGMGGWDRRNANQERIVEAQLALAKKPEFEGSVVTVETRDFYRPPESSPSNALLHWNDNAESFFLIGDAMGRAMTGLLRKPVRKPE